MMQSPLKIQSIYLFSLLTLLLGACSTTKYLKDDQYLLRKNSIEIQSNQKIKNKSKLKYELSLLYKQNPNGRFLFIPREWFHFATSDPNDTTSFDRWQRRVLGEPPVYYDTAAVSKTIRSMQLYMQHKGFYEADVYHTHDFDEKRKKVSVTYHIQPKTQLKIDSVYFESTDLRVDSILQAIKPQSFFQTGKELEEDLYNLEKERITQYMRDHGFAYFQSNFIGQLQADSTQKEGLANIYIEVIKPANDSMHRTYTIGNVNIYPQYEPILQAQQYYRPLSEKGYRFWLLNTEEETIIDTATILRSIFLKEGDLYRQSNFEKTNRQLSSLGVFKFVRIKQEQDTSQQNVLNFDIELTPNKNLEIGVDFDVNYTNRSNAATSAISGNLIGISGSPYIINRNVFGGAESFNSNLSAGFEFDPTAISSGNNFWNTIDLKLQNELYFPKFIDYLGIWKGLNSIKIGKKGKVVRDDFYTKLNEITSTRISASFNYLLLLDFYQYRLFNAFYGYDLQSTNERYIINHIGLDYLLPTIEPEFQEVLDSNEFLARSFGNQLFASLLFRDFNYLYSSRPNRNGVSEYFNFYVEMAGAEMWIGNLIYNEFALNEGKLRIGDLDFSQYVKTEFDYRVFKQYTPKHTFAARFNIGIALPFGFTTDVPYVKQFFVGGPNSIRAWAVRSLGPGGYLDERFNPQNNNTSLQFYQAADFKFEFNLEYRFDLFWLLKGAVFLDGGNIWTLKNDPDRPGAQFRFSTGNRANSEYPFYRQIALGTGMGFRLDFSYFIFRLDLGIKTRYPYPIRGDNETASESDFWVDFTQWRLRDINYNIGLGYPF